MKVAEFARRARASRLSKSAALADAADLARREFGWKDLSPWSPPPRPGFAQRRKEIAELADNGSRQLA
jgi:hypothetical protein